jgi:hypothetical protein
VNFSVEATGTPPPAYRWFFNGNALPGATRSTLTLNNVQVNNAGDYYVLVSNIVGVVTSRVATLMVQDPPVILNGQSMHQYVFAGTNLTFTCVATGAWPLAYQWALNGTTLPGQTTATLLLSNLVPSLSGSYSVTVTNQFGSATGYIGAITVSGPVFPTRALSYSNSVFTLKFNGHITGRFRLEGSTNLIDWSLLETLSSSAGSTGYQDRSASPSSRFYRLRWEP